MVVIDDLRARQYLLTKGWRIQTEVLNGEHRVRCYLPKDVPWGNSYCTVEEAFLAHIANET